MGNRAGCGVGFGLVWCGVVWCGVVCGVWCVVWSRDGVRLEGEGAGSARSLPSTGQDLTFGSGRATEFALGPNTVARAARFSASRNGQVSGVGVEAGAWGGRLELGQGWMLVRVGLRGQFTSGCEGTVVKV